MSEQVVVVGDLCLDLTARTDDSAQSWALLARGQDLTLRGTLVLEPGGSAWLFADALKRHSSAHALIVASVGNDRAGTLLQDQLVRHDLATAGVIALARVSTDIVVSSYLAESQRLMIRPATPGNNALDATHIQNLLTETNGLPEATCLWLSGYAIAAPGSERFKAVPELCTWARNTGIPVVLDLVPHTFRESVGPVSTVQDWIGHVDVLVGELTTVRRLGFWNESLERVDDRAAMIGAAELLSRDRLGGVIQHKLSSTIYGQAIARYGDYASFNTRPIAASGPRGIGDTLAVEALISLGLITPAKDHNASASP